MAHCRVNYMVLDCVVLLMLAVMYIHVYNLYIFIEFYNFCLSRTVELMVNDEFGRKQSWPDGGTVLLRETEERHTILQSG
jgi:hypothetical protein